MGGMITKFPLLENRWLSWNFRHINYELDTWILTIEYERVKNRQQGIAKLGTGEFLVTNSITDNTLLGSSLLLVNERVLMIFDILE